MRELWVVAQFMASNNFRAFDHSQHEESESELEASD
jgi:hypothetical protein